MKDNWKNQKAEAEMKRGTEKIMKEAQDSSEKSETLSSEKLEKANDILSNVDLPVINKSKTFEICLGVGMNQLFPEYIKFEVEPQMTKEDMDEFLKSIGGLINGYKRKSEPITDAYFFQCGPGWYNLIKNLIKDLIELGWNKEVCQVKEKFGGLRFYINEADSSVHSRIVDAEAESYNICEETGMYGELRKDLGWWKTLSDVEYLKLKNKK